MPRPSPVVVVAQGRRRWKAKQAHILSFRSQWGHKQNTLYVTIIISRNGGGTVYRVYSAAYRVISRGSWKISKEISVSFNWFFIFTPIPRLNCEKRVLFKDPHFSIQRSISKHDTNGYRATASPSVRFHPFKRRYKQSMYGHHPRPSV